MRKERKVIIEIIPLKDFKHKIELTKKYDKERISILSNTHICIERWEYE